MDAVAYMKNVIAPAAKARVAARTEGGASLVEYALLLALIAVVCIVGITYLGGRAGSQFSGAGSQLG